jgi:EVE domain
VRRQSDGAPFGAWLFKCNPRLRNVDIFAEQAAGRSAWCVAPTYRSGLIRAGDPAFLWVSGGDRSRPTPGLWGVGQVTGHAEPDTASTAVAGAPLQVGVALRLLADPVPRTVLRKVAALEHLEVLRIPAGSNPSWVTPSERDTLLNLIDPAIR